MTEEQTNAIIAWFRQRGHTVHTDGSDFLVTGRMIRAVCYGQYLGGGSILFADNAQCFDKPSKCPLIVRLPVVNFDELDKYLHFLASRQGYHWSSTYEYLVNPGLPREVSA